MISSCGHIVMIMMFWSSSRLWKRGCGIDGFHGRLAPVVFYAVAGVELLDDLAEPSVGEWICEEDECAEECKDCWAETHQPADRKQGRITLFRRFGHKAAEGQRVACDCPSNCLGDLSEEGVDRIGGALGPFARLVLAVLDRVGLKGEEQRHRQI